MEIRKANPNDLEGVFQVVQTTIEEVYPNWYTPEQVAFFQQYHSRDAIAQGITQGEVYLILNQSHPLGTGSIREGEIQRLFVLPTQQGNGVGAQLMDFLESKILEDFSVVELDASITARGFYLRRGYKVVEDCFLELENGKRLCWERMRLEP